MNAPKNKIDLTFTEFLYAVVAGSAFQRFDPYHWGWNETILVTALLVLADDWVLYHAQASRVESTPKRFALILVLDIFILLLWYSMALSGENGVSVPTWFLFFLSGFYLVIAIGELAMRKQTGRSIRMWTEFACSGFLFVAGLSALAQVTGPKRIFAGSILILTVVRIKVWRTVVFKPSEQAYPADTNQAHTEVPKSKSSGSNAHTGFGLKEKLRRLWAKTPKLQLLQSLVTILSLVFVGFQIRENTRTNKVELRGQLYDRQMRLAADMGAGDVTSTVWALAPKDVSTQQYSRAFLELVTKDEIALGARSPADLYFCMFEVAVFKPEEKPNKTVTSPVKTTDLTALQDLASPANSVKRAVDTKDLRALFLYTQNTFYHVHNIFDYKRDGIVSEEEWRVWKGLIREMHGHPMLLTVIWQGYQNRYFSKDFARFLQNELVPSGMPSDIADTDEFNRDRDFIRFFYPEMTNSRWPDVLPDY